MSDKRVIRESIKNLMPSLHSRHVFHQPITASVPSHAAPPLSSPPRHASASLPTHRQPNLPAPPTYPPTIPGPRTHFRRARSRPDTFVSYDPLHQQRPMSPPRGPCRRTAARAAYSAPPAFLPSSAACLYTSLVFFPSHPPHAAFRSRD